MKYMFFYFVFAVVGIVLSYIANGIFHDIFAIPRYRSLGETGRWGRVAQIVLLLLPFMTASLGAAILYFRKNTTTPSWREVLGLSLGIASIVFLLTLIFVIATGAWFTLLQVEHVYSIVWVMLLPAFVASGLFALLFPLILRGLQWKKTKRLNVPR